jgi:hypothetical protein
MEWGVFIVVLLAIIAYCSWEDIGDGPTILLMGVWLLIWAFWQPLAASPEVKAANKAREHAEQVARETPKVIREADGCQVYAFERSGREHFFTRCPATTSTETNWTESCGKNCRSHKQESIVTNNKP